MKREIVHLLSMILALAPYGSNAFSQFSSSLPSTTSHRPCTCRRIHTTLNLAFDVQTFQSAAAAVDNFYKTAPLESAFLTCGLKGSLADCLAQRIDQENKQQNDVSTIAKLDEQQQQHFDASRNLAYVIYGGMYTGIAQHIIYNEVFPHIFGRDPTAITILSEVLANALIVGPFLGIPVAYITKAVVMQSATAQASDRDEGSIERENPLAEGLHRYVEDVQLKGLLLKYWSLWVPVQAITFSVVPEHLRITFMAFVSFFWFVILSLVSQTDEDMKKADNIDMIEKSGPITISSPFFQRP